MGTTRNHGLDFLRSIAIILVMMSHYTLITGESIFGPFGRMGALGVDLFFALSGYLIGNQIFSALNKGNFSVKIFYIRRLLRTFPNYFLVLAIYCLLPFFREEPFTISLWKFFTFTMNFSYVPGAFSPAWSLCIEEQFYLVLPLLALLCVGRISYRWGWFIVIALLVSEIIIRSCIWQIYVQHAGKDMYLRMIYAPTFSRLDSLVLGVAIALLKIYQRDLWTDITGNGNFLLIFGILGYGLTDYIFQTSALNQFFSSVLIYSFLAISSMALTLSALSKNSLLSIIKVPGAMTLATWSYAIYLTHKPLLGLTHKALVYWNLSNSVLITLISSTLVMLGGSWLLYAGVEKHFLNFRKRFTYSTLTPKK